MTGNKFVIVLLVLIIGGTVVIGFLPQSPKITSTNQKLPLNSPQLTTEFNLPSLLALRIWASATPSPTPLFQPSNTPIPTATRTRTPTPPGLPTATRTPTPQFTKTPTPKPPTAYPTPTPRVLDVQRPGSSLEEIAKIAQDVSCTPWQLIMAIKREETGDRFLSTPYFAFYNKMNWWQLPYASPGDSCYGYSYNTITGLVPPDASGGELSPPHRCAPEVGNQSAASQGIMGLMQINQSEQNSVTAKFQKYFKGLNTPDRRVLFDAMVLGGFLYKNLSSEPSVCNLDWELKYIALTGCKFYGSCKYGSGGDYCQEICQYYNQYSGKNLNCATASDYVTGSATGCVLR